jgi:hypothetical protein
MRVGSFLMKTAGTFNQPRQSHQYGPYGPCLLTPTEN